MRSLLLPAGALLLALVCVSVLFFSRDKALPSPQLIRIACLAGSLVGVIMFIAGAMKLGS